MGRRRTSKRSDLFIWSCSRQYPNRREEHPCGSHDRLYIRSLSVFSEMILVINSLVYRQISIAQLALIHNDDLVDLLKVCSGNAFVSKADRTPSDELWG